jgi:3',5'-cyclic AMP phosphodiesterase CpdA
MRRAGILPAILLVLVLAVPLRPGNADAWSFAFASDSHNDRNGVFARVLAAVEDSDMEFLVHGGDMVDRNTREEWGRFLRATALFRKPLYPVIGNHELGGKDAKGRFARRFDLPGTSYSFAHRDARIIVLDNARGTLSDRRLAWLDRELAAHPKGKGGVAFLIVAMHIPPAIGDFAPHGTRSGYAGQSRELLRILKKHGADAVLCGHEHMNLAEDWEGIRVIVSGIATIPLLPLQRSGFFRIDLEEGVLRATFIRVEAKRAGP